MLSGEPFFVVYLRTLPVSQTIQHQMVGEVMTNELEKFWKKWAVAKYADSRLEGIS